MSELPRPSYAAKFLAEFLGTFGLILFGTGAVIVDQETGGSLGLLGITVVWGGIVTCMVYAFGSLSGAHINPAVTLSFWVAKMFPGREVIPYILSQCAGAIAASAVLALIFPENQDLGSTLPRDTLSQAFVLEVLITFFLMLVILYVVTGPEENRKLAGLIIGLAVLIFATFAGPITGASMNPARSLGPALISGNMEPLWLYWLAPITGALLAIVPWRITMMPREE